ncbi:MAG: hypothetical protein LBH75_07170 [Treponema sp.]|nr:hypothetical protein [Treponema sp.]
MKNILLVGVALFSLFASCATQKDNVMEIELENNGSVERIELLFRDNSEIITKDINEEYWWKILSIIADAEYDIEQYDEIKNPSGYMLKVIEQDYILKIYYSNNRFDEILVWKDSERIKINGRWHIIKNGKEELFNIIDNSKM